MPTWWRPGWRTGWRMVRWCGRRHGRPPETPTAPRSRTARSTKVGEPRARSSDGSVRRIAGSTFFVRPPTILSETFSVPDFWKFSSLVEPFFCSEFFFLQGLYLQCFFLSHDQIKTLLKSLKLFCFNRFSSSFSMDASIKQLRHNALFSFASAVAPVRQE